jgi:hypothetical protein
MKRPENHFYMCKYGGKGLTIPTRWKSRNPPPALPDDNTNSNDNPNSNDDTQIYIQDFATQVFPNLWNINKDVTIKSGEYLGIDKGSIIVNTTFKFTNYGTFASNGTFINSNVFTNNGKIENTGGFIVNLSGGQLVFNPNPVSNIVIFNRGGSGVGSVIVNYGGTYSGTGKIIGNQVQNKTTPKIDDFISLINATLIVFTKT